MSKKKIAARLLGTCFLVVATAQVSQASVSDRVMFDAKPAAKFQVIDSGEGTQSILVVTNAPFDVSIAGVIGEVSVDVTTSGQAQGRSFGAGAQHPGESEDRHHLATPLEAVIYEGQRATAARQGSLWDQAVHMTISYDPIATPRISVTPRD